MTVLSERGTPTPVAWTMLRAPRSLLAPIEPAATAAAVERSPLQPRYGQPVDRDSVHERPTPRRRPAPQPEEGGLSRVLESPVFRSFARSAASALGRELTRGLFGTRRRR